MNTSAQFSQGDQKVPRTRKTKTSLKTTRPKKVQETTFLDKIQSDIQNNQSLLNFVLGGLIVIVLGILLFNYFNKPRSDLGPSQTSESGNTTDEDVAKDNLPGNYYVKEGDTLFLIAQKYYDDGAKYTKIMETNKLENDNIMTGQVLNIPRLTETALEATPPSPQVLTTEQSPSPTPDTEQPSPSPQIPQNQQATGGAVNETMWGEKITSSTYTVVEGDWLSKIAGRAYGDIYQYNKIAEANSLKNPDVIEPGTILKIPR